jgi:hypothetical protein
MTSHPRIPALVVLATLSALPLHALAQATTEDFGPPPPTTTYVVPADVYVVPVAPLVVPDVVYVAPTSEVTYAQPVITYVAPASTYIEPPITVYGSRASEDELITNDVVYQLATDPRLSGKIGVETERNVVTLSGRVTTPGQAEIAARDAKSVDGVSEVRNLVRSRVGN